MCGVVPCAAALLILAHSTLLLGIRFYRRRFMFIQVRAVLQQ